MQAIMYQSSLVFPLDSFSALDLDIDEDMEECIDMDSEESVDMASDLMIFGPDRTSPLSFDEMPTTHTCQSSILFDRTNAYNIDIDDRQALATSPFLVPPFQLISPRNLISPRSRPRARPCCSENDTENSDKNVMAMDTKNECTHGNEFKKEDVDAAFQNEPVHLHAGRTRVRHPSTSSAGKSWTKNEDDQLIQIVAQYGPGKWTELSEAFERKNPKQCRERWHNILDPAICRDPFTQAEDALIIHMVTTVGTKWSAIARQLPGRTDNHTKNRWNATLKKLHSDARPYQAHAATAHTVTAHTAHNHTHTARHQYSSQQVASRAVGDRATRARSMTTRQRAVACY
jgi:hypothetical protein